MNRGIYNATAPTLNDGGTQELQLDVNGNLKTRETPVKTNTLLQDWTAVAQNTIVHSTELAITTTDRIAFLVQAALDTATAHTGTRFVVQVSPDASGDERWFPTNADYVRLIGTANAEDVTNNPLAAGGTTITIASTTGYTVLGTMVFIKDATLINSEIVRINAVTTDTSIGLLDGVTNAHANTADLFNVADMLMLDVPEGALRARIMVDNSYDADGSTLNYSVSVITI